MVFAASSRRAAFAGRQHLTEVEDGDDHLPTPWGQAQLFWPWRHPVLSSANPKFLSSVQRCFLLALSPVGSRRLLFLTCAPELSWSCRAEQGSYQSAFQREGKAHVMGTALSAYGWGNQVPGQGLCVTEGASPQPAAGAASGSQGVGRVSSRVISEP